MDSTSSGDGCAEAADALRHKTACRIKKSKASKQILMFIRSEQVRGFKKKMVYTCRASMMLIAGYSTFNE